MDEENLADDYEDAITAWWRPTSQPLPEWYYQSRILAGPAAERAMETVARWRGASPPAEVYPVTVKPSEAQQRYMLDLVRRKQALIDRMNGDNLLVHEPRSE